MKSKGTNRKGQSNERPFTIVDIDFLDNSGLSCEERLVYIVLRSYMDDQSQAAGTVCVPMDKIAKRASMSLNRAKRTIDKLIEHGYVTRLRPGTATTNIYTILDRTEGNAKNG